MLLKMSPLVPARTRLTLRVMALLATVLVGTTHLARAGTVSSSNDLDAARAELLKIAELHASANFAPTNFRIKGIRQPKDRSFVITQFDGKRRLEMTIPQPNGEKATIYRIDDGERLLSMNDDTMSIGPKDERGAKWMSIAWFAYEGRMLSIWGERRTVPDFCVWLAGQLGNSQFDTSAEVTITRSNEGAVIFIEYGTQERIELHLSAVDGWNVVSFRNVQRAPSSQRRSWASDKRTISTYQKIAPQVYFPKTIHTVIEESGQVARDQGTAGRRESGMEIESVEIDAFELPDNYFNIQSLAQKSGLPTQEERMLRELR